MNLFFHPNNTKKFNLGSNHSILSQILRDPIPSTPLLLDFSYLASRENSHSENHQVFKNECDVKFHKENFCTQSSFKLPTMSTAEFLNEYQCAHNQSTVQVESNTNTASYNLHEMKQVDETPQPNEDIDSTELILNAIFQLNKNFNIQPASEFDNWFPLYSDLPMYDD